MKNSISIISALSAAALVLTMSSCSKGGAGTETTAMTEVVTDEVTTAVSEETTAADVMTEAVETQAVVTQADDIALTSATHELTLAQFTYFYNTQYRSTMKTYGDYYEVKGLDPTGSIKAQSCYEGGTWFDFFLERTKADVRVTLGYAEYAAANGIALDDEDTAKIDSAVTTLTEACSENKHSLAAYLALAYGDIVSEDVYRSCFALQLLAEKGQAAAADKSSDVICTAYPVTFNEDVTARTSPVKMARSAQ